MAVTRKRNPNQYKNGGPRLRGMNMRQLTELLEKTSAKKTKAKIFRELYRKNKKILDKLNKESEALKKYSKEELFQLHLKHKKWSKVMEEITK